MKANGKNFKMFVYCHHDYMDMHPEPSFSTWESQEVANAAVNEMRKYYNSGTISGPREVPPIELFMARQSKYWKGYEEAFDKAALDCSQEWLDEYSYYVAHKEYDVASLLSDWKWKRYAEV